MTERPILFSGAMVRAILAGEKTQTRRVVKPQPYNDPAVKVRMHRGTALFGALADAAVGDEWKCPYGQPGDRLWVRETWAPNDGSEGGYLYRADHSGASGFHTVDLKTGVWTHSVSRWRPSIHMPRAVSRITLEITGVRVERLQAISEDDARAEGVEVWAQGTMSPEGQRNYSAIGKFERLWSSINGNDSWQADPWVWVVEFKRLEAAQAQPAGEKEGGDQP